MAEADIAPQLVADDLVIVLRVSGRHIGALSSQTGFSGLATTRRTRERFRQSVVFD